MVPFFDIVWSDVLLNDLTLIFPHFLVCWMSDSCFRGLRSCYNLNCALAAFQDPLIMASGALCWLEPAQAFSR